MAGRLYEEGLRVRREVLGAEYVDKAVASATDFNREFQELVTEYCWGASWGRDALSRRDRSLLNLAMLGVLGRNAEFKLHLKGALRNGCTKAESPSGSAGTATSAGSSARASVSRAPGLAPRSAAALVIA